MTMWTYIVMAFLNYGLYSHRAAIGVGHDYIGYNYIGHNYIGHDYVDLYSYGLFELWPV